MFEKLFIFLFFIFLCFVDDRSIDMLEDQWREEGDLNIELEEDIMFWILGRRIGRVSL